MTELKLYISGSTTSPGPRGRRGTARYAVNDLPSSAGMSIMRPTLTPCSALATRRGVVVGSEARVTPLERRLEPLLGGNALELAVLLGVRHHHHGEELATEIDRRSKAAQVI